MTTEKRPDRLQLMEMQRSRENGRAIPAWQAGRFPITRGLLLVGQEYRQRLKRHSLTARMYGVDAGFKAPPELWDCQLQRMTVDFWVLSGFETVEDDKTGLFLTDYAQTWVLCPMRNAHPLVTPPGMNMIT